MSATGETAAWPSRWPRRLLIAMHPVIVALPTIFEIVGHQGSGAGGLRAAVVLALVAVILWIQLRHSLAAARDARPVGWRWTLALLVLLVYLPMLWLDLGDWLGMQIMFVASGLMLLRGRLRLLVFPPVAAAVSANVLTSPLGSPAQVVFDIVGVFLWLGAVGVALFAAAWLVRVLGELHETRAELAEAAIGRERLRVSRDLHDLLGQSLSAISLKGDLAIRLLSTDPPAAYAEILSLTGLARSALRGVRTVASDEPKVSLSTEADGAATVLDAAGIDVQITMEPPPMSARVEQMLAWALREAVTNVLRHSEARTCTVTVTGYGDGVRLEVLNDRAHPPAESGTGLAGLAERARAQAGSVTAGPTPDGGFRLVVLAPRKPP